MFPLFQGRPVDTDSLVVSCVPNGKNNHHLVQDEFLDLNIISYNHQVVQWPQIAEHQTKRIKGERRIITTIYAPNCRYYSSSPMTCRLSQYGPGWCKINWILDTISPHYP